MEILPAKNRMDEERSAAEQGDFSGILRYFCFRHPDIAENPELYKETEEKIQACIEQGKANAYDWRVYDDVAREVYKENKLVPQPLSEERVSGTMKRIYASLLEKPKLIDEPPFQKETATVPELIQRRGAINSMKVHRRKAKYPGQGSGRGGDGQVFDFRVTMLGT
jgi:hypothetical protein